MSAMAPSIAKGQTTPHVNTARLDLITQPEQHCPEPHAVGLLLQFLLVKGTAESDSVTGYGILATTCDALLVA